MPNVAPTLQVAQHDKAAAAVTVGRKQRSAPHTHQAARMGTLRGPVGPSSPHLLCIQSARHSDASVRRAITLPRPVAR